MNIEVSKEELGFIVNGLGWLTEENPNLSKEKESAIHKLEERLEKQLEEEL